MSIPLDRLYHYIESVAQDVYGDTVIYHFYPHGSKKFENLHALRNYHVSNFLKHPLIFCNDQEPLDFELYQDYNNQKTALVNSILNCPLGTKLLSFLADHPEYWTRCNLQVTAFSNIFDHAIIMHSETNSSNVNKYRENNFIPVYYWCHAIIARDWYRYAQHTRVKKQIKKTFLIYNRAWTGTREYRIKFADLLVSYNLVQYCKTSFSFNCDNNYYKDYKLINDQFSVTTHLEDFFCLNSTLPTYSADIDILDYQNTLFEVVLETMFDDSRIHLTEKILRPIAVGQPFILASTSGSLKYLKGYGFKTFDSVIDESYDNIVDPIERLTAIIKVMKTISEWSVLDQLKYQKKIQDIVDYNKKYFFSDEFFNLITGELKNNLRKGLSQLEHLNKGEKYFQHRKNIFQSIMREDYKQFEKTFFGPDIVQQLISSARKYKIRNNKY